MVIGWTQRCDVMWPSCPQDPDYHNFHSSTQTDVLLVPFALWHDRWLGIRGENASLLFPPALKLRLPQPRPQLNAFQLLADFECDCLDLNSTINNLNNNFVRDFLFSALKIKLRHHITYLNEIRTLSEFKMRYWTVLMAERMSVE